MSPPREQIHVLVVDDEEPARHRLIDLLRKDASVGSISEAENGLVAVDKILAERPDLVFLDVQMPELDGLSVIDAVGPTTMPFTLLLRLARLMADWISRSLRSLFLSIQAPSVTFRPNSAAIGGTSSTPPVEE